jgi:hypothetical protein
MTNVRTAKFQSKETSVNPSFLISSLGRTSIDSTRVYLPTRYIKDWNKIPLTINHAAWDYNGEVVTSSERYSFVGEGYMIGLQVAKRGKNGNEECLIIGFSSKVLGGKNYFKGITEKTLPIAYNVISQALKNRGIGEISFENFKRGTTCDSDIKRDCIDSSNNLDLSYTGNHVIDTNGAKRTISQFAAIKGKASFKTGLQLGERKKGSQGNPFFKIYNKGIEIKQSINSTDDSFFNSIPTAANDSKITNVWRLEVTMKNKSMLEANGLPNTLGELVKVSEQQLGEVLEANLNKWVRKEIKPLQKQKVKMNLSSEDVLLSMAIENGFITLDNYSNRLIIEGISKRNVIRKKNRFVELYDMIKYNHSKPTKQLENSLKTDTNIQGNSSSDLSTFCGGILYAANA